MKKIWDVGLYYGTNSLQNRKIKNVGKKAYYENLKFYAGKPVLSNNDANVFIGETIRTGAPACIGRFGASELFCSSMFEFDIKGKKAKAVEQLADWSGFFPKDISLGERFNEILKASIREIDLLGIWNLRYDDYYIRKYSSKQIRLTYLYSLEPWSCPEKAWTSALAGRKVLVIHPFEESIKMQYKKHGKIFPGTDILPEFELKTLKAVQTVAGEIDKRFDSWFDALDWMFGEAMKIDFDIAIIGCGAYGLPLAAKLKKAGKQAVHLGGAAQILFGIKGKRWDEDKDKQYVRDFYNDSWIYPSSCERPENADIVENGCYW